MQMYADENDGWTAGTSPLRAAWFVILRPYLGADIQDASANGVLACPSRPADWMPSNYSQPFTWSKNLGQQSSVELSLKLDRINLPGESAAYTEAQPYRNRIGTKDWGHPGENYTIYNNVGYWLKEAPEVSGGRDAYAFAMHGNGSNIAFSDGHSASRDYAYLKIELSKGPSHTSAC